MAPKSLPTVSSLFIHLAFWPIHFPKKKNRWALSHDFKLVPFFFMFMFYSKRMVWAPFCLVYFSRMFLPWEMNLSRRVLWNSQIKIVKLSLILKIWEEWYNKCIITWWGWNYLFLWNVDYCISVVFKNKFQVKMSSNQFDLHFTLLEMSWSFNFYFIIETDDRN